MVQPNIDWEAFKGTLRGRFYPEHIRCQMFIEFAKLVWGNMTIAGYAKKFGELSATVVPHKRSKEEKQGIGGITFKTYQEAYEHAFNIYLSFSVRKAYGG